MMDFAATMAVILSEPIELSIAVKGTAALVAGLVAVRAARRARASLRHVVLASAFAVLLALPPVAMLSPTVTIAAIGAPPSAAAPSRTPVGPRHTPLDRILPGPPAAPAVTPPRTPFSWRAALAAAWGAGFLIAAAPIASSWRRLRRIRREGLPAPGLQPWADAAAREAGVRGAVAVLVHECVAAPLTCGIARPIVVLPPDATGWSESDLRRALVHELEHVRRRDWPVQLAARVTAALWWFQPLAWTALRQLCLAAEQACDDAVLRDGGRTEYADQLVQLARRLMRAPAQPGVAMANRSDLSLRVTALLDSHRSRGRAGALATTIAALAAALVVTTAPLRAVMSPSPAPNGAQRATGAGRPTSLDRALFRAAQRGDVDRIAELVQQGADVNAPIEGDGSPLIAAARAGRLEAVRLLLDRGANPDLGVPGDGNPLIMAAREGHAEIVALLLDRGARIDLVVAGDENALIQASGEGRLSVVKLLVSRGANVNAGVWADRYDGKPEWRSPLTMAERGRHADVAALLRASGAR